MASSYSSYHSGGGNKNADFTRLAEQIGSSIQKITQNVSSLKRIISQLGTAQDTEKLRSELHHIQHYTNELAKDTRDRFKELRSMPKSENVSEQRTRRMQTDRLTDDFTTVLQTFQTMQREVASKPRDNQTKRQSGSKGFGDDRESQLIQLESPIQNQMSMQMEDEVKLEVLREQEEAMHQLETDIVSVNEIFRDLATMVHEQGEVVDSIESQIESTHIHVGEANQQLIKARDYKASLRKKKCCLIVVLIIVIAVVIGIIIWQTSN